LQWVLRRCNWVLGVGDELEMVWVPARVDAASMMQLLALGNRTAQQLPAEPVGVAVLCLGDAAVGVVVPVNRQQVPS
jgi:hypothetical protein